SLAERKKRKPKKQPKPKVTIKPAQHVFRGDTVTLRCEIDGEGVTNWSYSWYKEGSTSVFSDQQELTFRSVTEPDAGKYTCKGSETEGTRWSLMSDAVTLTVSVKRPQLSKPKLTVARNQHSIGDRNGEKTLGRNQA
uniref:Ig-like domain-containing protein n=1 Tax=Cyprinus carpio TaxID=7962 RepID=A0A8C2L6C5_CYPCA